MSGDSPDVIPADRIGHAKDGLLDHMRMIQKASRRLDQGGDHALAVFLSVICVEEASKFRLLSDCQDAGRGVTVDDVRRLQSHGERIGAFLGRAPRADGAGRGIPPGPDRDQLAKRLNAMKQLALYYGFSGGGAVTLEGALGRGRLREASACLREVVSREISTLAHRADARDPRGATTDPGGARAGKRLARVAELARGIPADFRESIAVSMEDFPLALRSLLYHIESLEGAAVRLHNGKFHEASAFMSIMCLEEAAKFYMMARSRRRGVAIGVEQAEEMLGHKAKLSVFFEDARAYLVSRASGAEGAPPTDAVSPRALLRLNGLKEISIYFSCVGGRAITLRHLFGPCAGDISRYLLQVVPGLSSWMIMCDGGSENITCRHNPGKHYYSRFQDFVRFRTDPRNRVRDESIYNIIGMVERLNTAAKRNDAKGCERELARIRRHIKD